MCIRGCYDNIKCKGLKHTVVITKPNEFYTVAVVNPEGEGVFSEEAQSKEELELLATEARQYIIEHCLGFKIAS
jgi:hypothetical protein